MKGAHPFAFGPMLPAGSGPPSGAHAVSVYLIADRERLADIVQQIDFAKIAAIAR